MLIELACPEGSLQEEQRESKIRGTVIAWGTEHMGGRWLRHLSSAGLRMSTGLRPSRLVCSWCGMSSAR